MKFLSLFMFGLLVSASALAVECEVEVRAPGAKNAIDYALKQVLNRMETAYENNLSLESYEPPRLCALNKMANGSFFQMESSVIVYVTEVDDLGVASKIKDRCTVFLEKNGDEPWQATQVYCEDLAIDEEIMY